MINLPNFDLIAGGVINVTEGINTLALNSVGPNTQIQLRELPSTVTAGSGATTTTGGGSTPASSTIVTDNFLVQSLAGTSGEFVTNGNIILTSNPQNPGPPPAPPGVIIKINHINGNIDQVPNLLTDAKIFGYDPATGHVVRFSLDLTQSGLNQGTGVVDTSFTPIPVSGAPANVGLSVGRDGDRLVLLVGHGFSDLGL